MREIIEVSFAVLLVAAVGLTIVGLIRPGALARIVPWIGRERPSAKRAGLLFGACAVVVLVLGSVVWAMPHYAVEHEGTGTVPVVLGEIPTLTVSVDNLGLWSGTYKAGVSVDGVKAGDVQLPLDGRKHVTLEVPLPSSLTPGPHSVALGDTTIDIVALRPAAFSYSKLEVKPEIAKIRQRIDVRIRAENTGDVAGTCPGILTANGREVGTSPIEIGPGESTYLSFTVKRPEPGKCRLAIGSEKKKIMVVKPVRLANGHILRNAVGGGAGTIYVKNPWRVDALFFMVRLGQSKRPVLAIYLRSRGATTLSHVADGTYMLFYSHGRDWNRYTKDFLTAYERKRVRTPVALSTRSYTKSWTEHWAGWRGSFWWGYPVVYSQVHWQRYTSVSRWKIYLNQQQGKYHAIEVKPKFFPKLK